MDHADAGGTARDDGFEDVQIRHLMDVDQVGLEILDGAVDATAVVLTGKRIVGRERLGPSGLTGGLGALNHGQGVAAATQFVGGLPDVFLGAPERSLTVMNKAKSHR